jgi:hypothetical protein
MFYSSGLISIDHQWQDGKIIGEKSMSSVFYKILQIHFLNYCKEENDIYWIEMCF